MQKKVYNVSEVDKADVGKGLCLQCKIFDRAIFKRGQAEEKYI